MIGRMEIEKRFGTTATHPEGTASMHNSIRLSFATLAKFLDVEIEDGREKSLAFTALEEASMWAHKALANELRANQVAEMFVNPVTPDPKLSITEE